MDSTVLDHARQGIFPLSRMKEYTGNYFLGGGKCSLSDYFTAKYDGALFAPRLAKNVLFTQHNLAMDRGFSEFNVIVCRNVLIYFDRALKDHSLESVFGEPRHPRRAVFGAQGVPALHRVRDRIFDALGARENLPEKQVSGRYGLVVVGTSTGGLHALTRLPAGLPANFHLPIAIVQHRSRDSDERLIDAPERSLVYPRVRGGGQGTAAQSGRVLGPA